MTARRATSDAYRKVDPDPASNTEGSGRWGGGRRCDDRRAGVVSTGAQASYLKALSEQAHDPGAFDETLTKAEASKRIDALKGELAQQRGKQA